MLHPETPTANPTAKPSLSQHGNQRGAEKRKKNSPPIPQTLRPARQTQQAKKLRLDLNRDVELLRDGIRAEGDPAHGPQEHHGRGQTLGRFGAVVADDLRDQLDAPAYGADCAEDVGGGGDGGLGGHCFFWWKGEGGGSVGDFVGALGGGGV